MDALYLALACGFFIALALVISRCAVKS